MVAKKGLRRVLGWFRFYGYDGRYGRCIGIAPIDGGMAIWMSDGSKHYIGDKEWLGRFFIKLFFKVYVLVRRGF